MLIGKNNNFVKLLSRKLSLIILKLSTICFYIISITMVLLWLNSDLFGLFL